MTRSLVNNVKLSRLIREVIAGSALVVMLIGLMTLVVSPILMIALALWWNR